MKKLIKKFFTIFCICFSLIYISSCQSVASVVSVGAIIAQVNGEISTTTANSIIDASSSVANAAEKITPSQEYFLGRAVGAKILSNYGLYKDDNVQEYLNFICQAITINSEKPALYKGYFVAILDSDEINAFATSGGHILITKGLLKNVTSEDELAAVIAHEVSHIHLSHSIKAIKSSRTTEAVLKTGKALTSTILDDQNEFLDLMSAFDKDVGEIVSTMVDSGYSKSQEYEADEHALTLLKDAGYNPFAMKNMLDMLKAFSNDKKGFSKTHPSPKSRINKISKNLKEYKDFEIPESRIKRFDEVFPRV